MYRWLSITSDANKICEGTSFVKQRMCLQAGIWLKVILKFDTMPIFPCFETLSFIFTKVRLLCL